MRKTLLLVAVALFTVSATAQGLPEADNVPGDSFHGLERSQESVTLALEFNTEKKAEKRLDFALERLAEAEVLAARGQNRRANRSVDRYIRSVERTQKMGSSPEVRGRLNSVVSRETSSHMKVLSDREMVPGDTLYRGLRKSENAAVQSEPDPVRRARKQARVAGHRINETRLLVERNRSDRAVEVLDEYRKEMEQLENIEDSVTRKKERLEIGKIINSSASRHVEVLQEVREKVPLEAREGIDTAIEASGKRARMHNNSMKRGGEERTSGNFTRTVDESVGVSPEQR